MAKEISLSIALNMNKPPLQYASQPVAFTASLANANGPSPGSVQATTAGVDIPLTQFTRAGVCWIQNLDGTNFVTIGVKSGGTFIPMIELLPGEFYVFRFSRSVLGGSNTFHAVADTANVFLRVDCFDT